MNDPTPDRCARQPGPGAGDDQHQPSPPDTSEAGSVHSSRTGRLFACFQRVFARRGALFWVLFGTGGLSFLGAVDYLTGPDIAWSLFYLIPIFIAAWFVGGWAGGIFSTVGAVVWWVADVMSGHAYGHPLIGVWNATMRLAFFFVVTWLTDALRHALDREREIARVDFTTGVLNSRAFMELLPREMARCRRNQRPISVAYADLDDFKRINDSYGHKAGDDVLRHVAHTMRGEVREGDVVARVGGDEFAVLFPDTDSEGACTTMRRVKKAVLASLTAQGRPATLSIGILTCQGDSCDAENVIRGADALMYEVKTGGKDGIRGARYSASSDPPSRLGKGRDSGVPT